MRGNNPALELQVVDASTNWETVMIGPSHFTDDIWDMRQFMPAKTTSECNKYLKFYYIKNPNMKHIAKQYAYYKLGRVKPKSVQLYINGFLRPFFEFCEMNGIHRLSEMTREQFFEYNRYYFMFQLSYVHQSNNFSKVFDYSKYEEDAFLSLYVPILANVEVAILKLNRRYPYWDSYEELNELSAIFKEFVIFEKKIQHKTLCESTS